MGRSCIHFSCRYCGKQEVCLDRELGPGDVLTCTGGHIVFLRAEDREKINMAFKSFVGTRIDIFL